MNIRDIDVNRIKVADEFKQYILEALNQLDSQFTEKGWNKFLSEKQINSFYEYTITEFGENDEDKNEGGQVSFGDEKTIKVADVKDISTLKHELLHAIKGEKENSGIKTQGVKLITINDTIGKSTEEYLNEMMAGENGDFVYRDGTSVIRLMYEIMGDEVIEASLKNDRDKFENVFYDITGSDDFLKTFEGRLRLINPKNISENEVYMLAPATLLIELYAIVRRQEITNIDLTKAEAKQMLEKDEKIRDAIKKLGFENLSDICMDIFDKEIMDIYKSDEIYELDVPVSGEFEKMAKLIGKKDLSHVSAEYIDNAINGGETLKNKYIIELQELIKNGHFTNDENGLMDYLETIQWYQKNIAIPVENNKQRQELQELDENSDEWNIYSTTSEVEAFSDKEFKKLNEMISFQMFGKVDEEFINFLSNTQIIHDDIIEEDIATFVKKIKGKETETSEKTQDTSQGTSEFIYQFFKENGVNLEGITTEEIMLLMELMKGINERGNDNRENGEGSR